MENNITSTTPPINGKSQFIIILVLQVLQLAITGAQQILSSIHKFKLDLVQIQLKTLHELNTHQSKQLKKIKKTQKDNSSLLNQSQNKLLQQQDPIENISGEINSIQTPIIQDFDQQIGEIHIDHMSVLHNINKP